MRFNCDNRSTTGDARPASANVDHARGQVPPASSRINRSTRRLAQSTPSGSSPRSKRNDESLCRFSRRAVVRIDIGSKLGRLDQQFARCVGDFAVGPPHHAADADRALASAMTHMPGPSS